MKTLSKIMATTAVCTLFAGGAIAQAPVEGAEVDEQVVAPEVGTDTTGTVDVAPEVVTTPTAPTEAEDGVDPGAVTGVVPGENDPITVATEALRHGEPASAVSSDGRVLGTVNQATADERGAAQLSIALDPTLDAGAPNVTFVGMADVDADGRIVLPFAEADFLSRIRAQTGG
jgi:hypothetical protein